MEAVADRVAATAGEPCRRRFRNAPMVFTAHSIPRAMADGSPYAATVPGRLASGVAESGWGAPDWSLAYQSRSGNPRDPWLEPRCERQSSGSLRAAGEKAVIAVPIGFVCDHVEVLYDLDVAARQRAQELGMGFYRAPAVNDHPLFIDMLAEIVSASR